MKRRKYITLNQQKERITKRFRKYWHILSAYYRGQEDGRLQSEIHSQSKNQKQFQADLESHGGEYLLARSIEDLEREGI